MSESAILDAIKSQEKLHETQMNGLENLIKNNYTNLSGSINEIKETQTLLMNSDKQQAIEIALLDQDKKNKEREFNVYKESEASHGRKTSLELSKLRSMPWKMITIFISSLGLAITLIAILLKSGS